MLARVLRVKRDDQGAPELGLFLGQLPRSRPHSSQECHYTNAKVKPAWSGAQPMEIPPWL
jgi:hypothetical protein